MPNTIDVLRGLPDSRLLRVLDQKVRDRRDVDFNFLGLLDELRRKVAGEVRQINELFPEYTPHDEVYHLARLFHVADTILGPNLIEAMNETELFLLACALYGHDWGMAVNEVERRFILGGGIPNESDSARIRILPDERSRLQLFLEEQGLKTLSHSTALDLDAATWREYVRQTHAFRSGERCRQFFEPIDNGVAEALARMCVGHWLDIGELRRHDAYPRDLSVLRRTINLPALTVYLRLIDLFDLGEDRTPYVIWKFVAPRDPRARLEWAKHRALQPITCPAYQTGRIIRVDGSTNDHEVFAALEDLRRYCESQFDGCVELLEHLHDKRHALDIHHVAWRVITKGFRPISIRFEFDRDQMFNIISTEVYRADPYVFLRELLQNSIDAIRLRRVTLRANNIEPSGVGVISVSIEQQDTGHSLLIWDDDGIGMDEAIVRDYLSVAGKSYYRSAEFQRKGIPFDPIARFGIGLLSCFTVAERVEIETRPEPYYFHEAPEALAITIPAMRRHFRIATAPASSRGVGTTIRVFIEHHRVSAVTNGALEALKDVSTYLCSIAGFVEFPIFVTEDRTQTVIVHPAEDTDRVRKRFGENSRIYKLNLGYRWTDGILPQDERAARTILEEKAFDLRDDLGLEGFEGCLSLLLPKDSALDSIESRYGEARFVRRGSSTDSGTVIRRNHLALGDAEPLSASAKINHKCQVYQDGILVSDADEANLQLVYTGGEPTPEPRLVVNLPKSSRYRVNLARTEFIETGQHWSAPIRDAFIRYLSETVLSKLTELNPEERLYELARFMVFYHLEADDIWTVFPRERWPFPYIFTGGKIAVVELGNTPQEFVFHLPDTLWNEASRMRGCYWFFHSSYDGLLTRWAGQASLDSSHSLASGQGVTAVLAAMPDLWKLVLQEMYTCSNVRFLSSGKLEGAPLAQRVSRLTNQNSNRPDIGAVHQKVLNDPLLLSPSELTVFNRELITSVEYNKSAEVSIFRFQGPFDKYFAYGSEMLNLTHPLAQTFLRCYAILALRLRKVGWDTRNSRLKSAFDELPFLQHFGPYGGPRNYLLSDLNRGIEELISAAQACDSGAHDIAFDGSISLNDFVPQTFKYLPGIDRISFVEERHIPLDATVSAIGTPL